jgi:GTPase SAR1 family protein
VGKTSMLNRFCYNKFDPNLTATVGCDFTTKIMPFEDKNTTIKL